MEKQFNKVSGLAYQGNNWVDLLNSKSANNFSSNEWVTFLQAKGLGLKVKKGSRGVRVFKGFRSVDVKNKDGKLKSESKPLGYAVVFNLEQTEK